MGYNSNFDISIPYGTKTLETIKDDFYNEFDWHIDDLYCLKWYSWDADMLEFSKRHPTCIFQVYRDGEENGDHEKAYFFNGTSIQDQGIISYPEIDNSTFINDILKNHPEIGL